MPQLMTPCHFVGKEGACQACLPKKSNPCTERRFGEFCANLQIQILTRLHTNASYRQIHEWKRPALSI